jgi:hypothetical protein
MRSTRENGASLRRSCAAKSTISRSSRRHQMRRLLPVFSRPNQSKAFSEKYSFLPTSSILTGIRENGWVPVRAQEQSIRTEARRGFQKHIVRFARVEHLQSWEKNGNGGGSVNYGPNSFNGPVQRKAFDEPPLPLEGVAARYNHRDSNDDYTQADNLFRLITAAQRERLFGKYRPAHEGREHARGNSAAPDLPLLPGRSCLWNGSCQSTWY